VTAGDGRTHESSRPMRDVQALGDWKKNRILLTGDNSGE
jgi:hypothetical protein